MTEWNRERERRIRSSTDYDPKRRREDKEADARSLQAAFGEGDRRQAGNRRVPENIMGRRKSDQFDIGQWLVTNYVDPSIKQFADEMEKRLETKMEVERKATVEEIGKLIGSKDEARGFAAVIGGGLGGGLVAGVAWAVAKMMGRL